MRVIELDFDERDPLYKCCCGIFHVKVGILLTSVKSCFLIYSDWCSHNLSIERYYGKYINHPTFHYSIQFGFQHNRGESFNYYAFPQSLGLEYSGIAAVIVSSASMFIATFTFRPKLVIAYLITQVGNICYRNLSYCFS